MYQKYSGSDQILIPNSNSVEDHVISSCNLMLVYCVVVFCFLKNYLTIVINKYCKQPNRASFIYYIFYIKTLQCAFVIVKNFLLCHHMDFLCGYEYIKGTTLPLFISKPACTVITTTTATGICQI